MSSWVVRHKKSTISVVLTRLQKAGLTLNLDKCEIRVSYGDFWVPTEQIFTQSDKRDKAFERPPKPVELTTKCVWEVSEFQSCPSTVRCETTLSADAMKLGQKQADGSIQPIAYALICSNRGGLGSDVVMWKVYVRRDIQYCHTLSWAVPRHSVRLTRIP